MNRSVPENPNRLQAQREREGKGWGGKRQGSDQWRQINDQQAAHTNTLPADTQSSGYTDENGWAGPECDDDLCQRGRCVILERVSHGDT